MSSKIGIALLGAGIFAREEHLTAIKACPALALKAIYSRSKSSAESLATELPGVDVYFTTNSPPTQSLEALLSRKDIVAVIIALPIPAQPEIIKKCLLAGKHVLSEKPMAPSISVGRDLLKSYNSLPVKPVWMVAEQLRFDRTFTKGAELIREKVGKVYAFSLELYAPVKEDDKFYNTSWRGIPEYQGGFLLDGGVHFVAGLRKLLTEEIETVSGFSRQLQPHTPPVDTLHALVKLADGTSGTVGLSWGCKAFLYEIRVIGEGGCLKLTMGKVTFEDLKGEKEEFEFKEAGGGMDAVRREVAAFAKSIESGKGDVLGAPEEGLRDVAFIEMVLKSGECGGEPMKFDFY